MLKELRTTCVSLRDSLRTNSAELMAVIHSLLSTPILAVQNQSSYAQLGGFVHSNVDSLFTPSQATSNLFRRDLYSSSTRLMTVTTFYKKKGQ